MSQHDTDELQDKVREVMSFTKLVALRLHRLQLRATGTHKWAAALYAIAMEHAGSILQLIELGRHASAAALVRPAREAMLRGAWIHYCSDDARNKLDPTNRNDAGFPGTSSLVNAIMGAPSGDDIHKAVDMLIDLIDIDTLHDLTHGGVEQYLNRLDGSVIRSSYTQNNLIVFVEFSLLIIFCSAYGKAKIASEPEIEKYIVRLFSVVVGASTARELLGKAYEGACAANRSQSAAASSM